MLFVLKFDNVTFRRNNNLLFAGLNWTIKKNENWAITGPSGSGKTMLLSAMQGHFFIAEGAVTCNFDEKVEDVREFKKYAAFVSFQDQALNNKQFYYQQRYNSSETEGTLLVKVYLGIDNIGDPLFETLGINNLIDREFIKLSNGENRKVQIAKALLKRPKLLVLDNPYVGLDVEARQMLNLMIDQMIASGIQVIMTTDGEELPERITHVLNLNNLKIVQIGLRGSFNNVYPIKEMEVAFPFPQPLGNGFEVAVQLSDVVVEYGKSRIINRINWKVNKLEKWALTGRNGAGKSMLLSLLYADNPQVYANHIVLFDNLRGQGESIWDVKERIGFLSPELHLYFDKMKTAEETALDGLYEHPFKKAVITEGQRRMLDFLFGYYGIDGLKSRKLHELSTGQQRLMLFFRVLLKNPELLLLDEPFQGFDKEMIGKSKAILDSFCKDRTLIFVCTTNRKSRLV
jgi:ABC-type molybdenum transport system, ATPase component/photorepair protein PhrA